MAFAIHEHELCRSIAVVLNLNPAFIHSDVGAVLVYPRAGVKVSNAIAFSLDGHMGVATEDVIRSVMCSIGKRAPAYFVRESQPTRIDPIQIPREPLLARVQLLDPKK